VNARSRQVLLNLYRQMPEPRVVVAAGICACSGCVFAKAYNILGGVDTVLPVDVYVPGCAVRPEALIDGIVKSLPILEARHGGMKKGVSHG
jgi:ech hydrogenase subunit C